MVDGNFSLLHFYERRARRILPALFFLFLCLLPIAWLWMMPFQLKPFAESMASAVFFASNIYFWPNTGYFGSAAEELPLLHTWSLAVEEQFYLVFPVILLGLCRIWPGRIKSAFLLGALASFVLAEWASQTAPNAGFFLAPTRGWELLIGALAALVNRDQLTEMSRRNEILSGFGVAMIITSTVVFTEHTRVPSAFTLAPTVGTMLVLLYATPSTFVARFLSLRPVVGIGLISYSFYLWHQPVLAFARIRFAAGLSDLTLLGLILLACLIAYISWRFIERPFRQSHKVTRRSLVTSLGCGAIALVAVSAVIWSTDGLEEQFRSRFGHQAEALNAAIQTRGEAGMQSDDKCRFWTETVTDQLKETIKRCAGHYGPGQLVIGDSHSMDLYNALFLASNQPFIIGISKGGCRLKDVAQECPYDDIVELAKGQSAAIQTIFFTQSGSYFLEDNYSTIRKTAINATVNYLSKISANSRTVWVGPQIETGIDLRKLHPAFGHQPGTNAKLLEGLKRLDRYLSDKLAKTSGIEFVSKIEAIDYQHARDFIIDNQYTYSDIDHWSTHGERIFGKRLVDTLQNSGLLDR